jgi:hypothetical protein
VRGQDLAVEDPVAKNTCEAPDILLRSDGLWLAMRNGLLEYWSTDLEAVPLIEIWHIVA